MEKYEEVLVAIRQMIRAIDLHSKQLSKHAGLTGPQLILMQAIQRAAQDQVTIRELSEETSMSQATATAILDRLERNGYVERIRNEVDKRKVHAQLTPAGMERLASAPQALQDDFIARFNQLDVWEQSLLLSSVQRLSAMMNAENIDAAPMLDLGNITRVETTDHKSNKTR